MGQHGDSQNLTKATDAYRNVVFPACMHIEAGFLHQGEFYVWYLGKGQSEIMNIMHNLPIMEPTRGSMMVPMTNEQTNHWTNNKTDETKPLHIFVLFLGNYGILRTFL